MRKIPFAGLNSRPNVSEGYEVPLSYRGDRRTLLMDNDVLVQVIVEKSLL